MILEPCGQISHRTGILTSLPNGHYSAPEEYQVAATFNRYAAPVFQAFGSPLRSEFHDAEHRATFGVAVLFLPRLFVKRVLPQARTVLLQFQPLRPASFFRGAVVAVA